MGAVERAAVNAIITALIWLLLLAMALVVLVGPVLWRGRR